MGDVVSFDCFPPLAVAPMRNRSHPNDPIYFVLSGAHRFVGMFLALALCRHPDGAVVEDMQQLLDEFLDLKDAVIPVSVLPFGLTEEVYDRVAVIDNAQTDMSTSLGDAITQIIGVLQNLNFTKDIKQKFSPPVNTSIANLGDFVRGCRPDFLKQMKSLARRLYSLIQDPARAQFCNWISTCWYSLDSDIPAAHLKDLQEAMLPGVAPWIVKELALIEAPTEKKALKHLTSSACEKAKYISKLLDTASETDFGSVDAPQCLLSALNAFNFARELKELSVRLDLCIKLGIEAPWATDLIENILSCNDVPVVNTTSVEAAWESIADIIPHQPPAKQSGEQAEAEKPKQQQDDVPENKNRDKRHRSDGGIKDADLGAPESKRRKIESIGTAEFLQPATIAIPRNMILSWVKVEGKDYYAFPTAEDKPFVVNFNAVL